jgi:hypothetical protein
VDFEPQPREKLKHHFRNKLNGSLNNELNHLCVPPLF